MSQSENTPENPENAAEVIFAISNNDIHRLESLLNTCPGLRSILDEHGNNLLQHAININQYEAFAYLLSLNCFDLEATNKYQETALLISLTRSIHYGLFLSEYYATDLVERGANIHTICYDNNTFLHLALMRHQFKTAQILIEKGADLNAQNDSGCTPLHMLFHTKLDPEGVTEGVGLMLYYGADVSICDKNGNLPFELAVLYDPTLVTAQENLLYCTFDAYSEYKMSAEILLQLLETNSFLFAPILDFVSEVVFVERVFFSAGVVFELNSEFLKVLIEKFDYVLKEFFVNDFARLGYDFLPILTQNWEMLLHSHLAADTVDFIGHLSIKSSICNLSENQISRKEASESIFYLLSYGLEVYEEDMDCVYKKYGYCDLFKTLLFMDIKTKQFSPSCDVVPRIIFDVDFDLDAFLRDPHNYSVKALEELLDYFARPTLKKFCFKLGLKKITDKAEKLPRVPHLLELARDTTRQFLVINFNLENTKDFYSVLNWLPISVIYKRILSFETKLYR